MCLKELISFGVKRILNMKVMVIKNNKTCHLMIVLTKLKLTWETIINLQNSDTWNIQLTTGINFIFTRNTDKK